MRRLSLRVRLTLVFTLVMAAVLGVTGLVLYTRFRADLDNTVDRNLHTRSDEVTALTRHTDRDLAGALGRATGSGDDFAQVLDRGGAVVATTPQVDQGPLLTGAQLRSAARSASTFEHPSVGGLEGRLRLRARPVTTSRGRLVVVVGTALGERNDSLRTLAILLAVGGVVALALAALAGYGVAAGALRPVEAMRRRAAAVSARRPGQRLPVPESDDEIARLGETLNEMLARLEAAFERERAFVADASHELRMPLGILKAELELARRRGRSLEELQAALDSAAEETDRLIALAEDLLVLARADQGRLPVRLEELEASELLASVVRRYRGRARDLGRPLDAAGGEGVRLRGDRQRLEQALGNLVDNALRHGDGEVVASARVHDGAVELHVTDQGGGFPPAFLDHAFERFARADGARSRGGAGLGLAIVGAIAAAHGGDAHAANRPDGGGDVWLSLDQSSLVAPTTLPLSASTLTSLSPTSTLKTRRPR